MLEKHKDIIHTLSVPERFLFEITQNPHYHDILKVMYYQATVSEVLETVERRIMYIDLACDEVRSSNKMKTFLEVCLDFLFYSSRLTIQQLVLKFGNQLNSGIQGNACGFTIASLVKVYYDLDATHELHNNMYILTCIAY
jgi:hypothetical protein